MPVPGGIGEVPSITGIVLGAGGQPLRGVCVIARGVAHSLARPDAAAVSGLTDAGGRYALAGLSRGAYVISYRDCADPGAYFEQWSGGADLEWQARPVFVGPAARIRLAPLRLRPVRQAAFIAGSAARLRRLASAGGGGNVSGTVRNRAGKRLGGVCVFVYPKGNYFGGEGESTGRKGRYGFSGLPPGKYQVQFTAGCPNPGNYAPQYWKYAASPARAAVIRLRPGKQVTGVDARLGPGGVLSGTVRAAGTGTPLEGVCVFVISVKPAYLYQLEAVTAADGRYKLKAMAGGRYQLQFEPDCGNTGNYLPLFPRGTVRVTAGKTTAGVDASLPPGAEISGVVTGPGGSPVAGICVYDDSNFPFAHTGADGSYSITRLGAGPNDLAFEGGCGNSGSYAPQYYPGQANPAAAIPVTLSAGQVRTGVDASLSRGGVVTGMITGTAGQRLRGACAEVLTPSALEPNNQNFFIPFNDEIPFFSAARAHAGVYRIRNLAPGLYYALFGPCAGSRYPLVWFKDQGAFGRASLISVSARPVTAGINAVLPSGGTISGTVTGRAGRRLSGYCITAYNTAGQDWITMLQATSHRGAYKITGLAPGRYKLLFGSCNLGDTYAAQWYPAAASQHAGRAVLVRPGRDTTRVNAALARGGSVSGRVTDAATGKPDRYCGVIVALDSSGNFMAGAFVRADGRYRIGHLLAGRYTLQACGLGLVNKNVVVTGTRPTTGVSIVLPRTGSMAGQALDSTGTTPEAGVCVTAFPRTGPGDVAVAATGRRGRWALTGLDTGSYRVLFSPDCMAGFPEVAPQWFNDKPSLHSATPVTITARHTTTAINAKLAAPGSITGTVTDPAHAALPGICVIALPQARGQVPVTAVTAANGTFTIASLAPGSYLVRFDSGCDASGYRTQWYNNAPSKPGAIPVTVTSGATTPNVNAAMRRLTKHASQTPWRAAR